MSATIPVERKDHHPREGAVAVRDPDGSWGLSASSLRVLFLRMRDERYWGVFRDIYRIGKRTAERLSNGEKMEALQAVRAERGVDGT